MNQRLKQFMKANWLMVWIVSAVIALTAVIVAGRYIAEHNKVKRVVAVTSGTGQRFSSDRLVEVITNGSDPAPRPMRYEVDDNGNSSKLVTLSNIEGDYFPISISIWNYHPSNPSSLYGGNLAYTLTVQLTDTDGHTLSSMLDGGKIYACTSVSEDTTPTLLSTNVNYTRNYVLNEEKTADTLTLYFSKNLLDENVAVTVTAEAADQELNDLCSVFYIQQERKSLDATWKGAFVESAPTLNSEAYDGFNYVITGFGTRNDLKFYWDSDKIAVCREGTFLSGIDTSVVRPEGKSTGTWKEVTFSVTEYCSLQLYMKQAETNYNTTTKLESYVWFPDNQ